MATGELGISQPVFAEPGRTRDPNGFGMPHASDNQAYAEVRAILQTQVVPFERSRLPDEGSMPLSEAYRSRGAEVEARIREAGRIVFHAVGDTGSSDPRNYGQELRGADQLSADARTDSPADRPAFFLHLGDVVYSFGESGYCYDPFYEPYRDYPAPILAVPGNHDSFIVPGTAPDDEPLKTFASNFCAERPTITREAGSLHRTASTQPGVYFALDAPFVRIVALFSNALEDPGVISSECGRWPTVPDHQLGFLRAQLRRAKAEPIRAPSSS